MKVDFFKQISENYSNIKFHENPSDGSPVVPCGRTERRTDMTKLIVAFRNVANVPNKALSGGKYVVATHISYLGGGGTPGFKFRAGDQQLDIFMVFLSISL